MSKNRTDLDRITMMLKALSNTPRLRIFLKLAACCAPGSCSTHPASMRRCVGEIGADLGLAASTVSHHVKELRQAGIMQVQRKGQKIECWLSDEALHRLAAFFGNIECSIGRPVCSPVGGGRDATRRK